MLRNYLKIAFRNISRNKSSSFINIGGLAIALTAFLIIMLFVRHEMSYDTFFPESESIYRLALENKGSQFNQVNTVLPEPIAGELKELYPEVKDVKFYLCGWDAMIKEARNNLREIGYHRRDILFEKYD